jgi:hypothetical protein
VAGARDGVGLGRAEGDDSGEAPDPSRRTIIREMRGIPFFLLREYLQDLGGTATGEDRVEGPGWSAHLEKMEPFRLGSLAVGQTRLTIEIDDEIADEFMARFELKTLRAGA